jgi:tetratricopeptide (TPR) repeat protein
VADRPSRLQPLAGITTLDWLATPAQALAEVTTGAVHHDGLDQLHPVRRALSWYPDDVWRYVLACQWRRISQEEPFVGQCGEVGDELGSAVVAARLVRLRAGAATLLQVDQYDEAVEWSRRGLAISPGSAGLWCTLSTAYRRLGRYQQALNAARDGLTAQPKRSRATECLAMALEIRARQRGGAGAGTPRSCTPDEPKQINRTR